MSFMVLFRFLFSRSDSIASTFLPLSFPQLFLPVLFPSFAMYAFCCFFKTYFLTVFYFIPIPSFIFSVFLRGDVFFYTVSPGVSQTGSPYIFPPLFKYFLSANKINLIQLNRQIFKRISSGIWVQSQLVWYAHTEALLTVHTRSIHCLA